MFDYQPLPYAGRVAVIRFAPAPDSLDPVSVPGEQTRREHPQDEVRSERLTSQGAEPQFRCEAQA